jgi:hypothetical protein
LTDVAVCLDCSGTRSVPDLFGDLGPCPSCVIDAGETFVVLEPVDDEH